jgi:hypothetical protein
MPLPCLHTAAFTRHIVMFFQATPAFLPLRRVFQVNLKPLTLSLLLFDVMISF